MEKTAWKGGALLAPVPAVLVSCGDMQESNIITIGWTGILNTKPCKTYISVRPERHSYAMIKKTMEFVINLPSIEYVRSVDLCGCKSGKNTDKWLEGNFTKQEPVSLSTPMIDQCPISLECKVCDIVPLGTHDMFIAEIVAVHVANDIVDVNGRLRIERAKLFAYAHGQYFALGEKLGDFGYSVKKKPRKPATKKRKPSNK